VVQLAGCPPVQLFAVVTNGPAIQLVPMQA
jgi:hypothetical protein